MIYVQPLIACRRAILKTAVCLLVAASLFAAKPSSGAIGGGYTQAGIVGEYFSNNDLSGSPTFVRREVRVDFDWGTVLPVGGSHSTGYAGFPTDNFSIRYTGELIAAFSEEYTLKVVHNDGARLYIRPVGAGSWTTLIDQWTSSGTHTATYTMASGSKYEIRLEYRDLTGSAELSLLWSCASTPEEVIDVVTQLGYNVTYWAQAYTDIVKSARAHWEPWNGYTPSSDAQGWPTSDCALVFQESLSTGLAVDPLMRGRINFSFTGKATCGSFGNMTSPVYSYNSGTNTTTGYFYCVDNGSNASYFRLTDTDRDGSGTDHDGITNLRMMRPVEPDSETTYDPGTIFNDNFKEAFGSYFTVLRMELHNANQERYWSDRTPPDWFNQYSGRQHLAVNPPDYGAYYSNGPSWEYMVMLANELGRDMYINLPVMVEGWDTDDTSSYVYKLAKLIRYGSDASGEPYSTYTANPVYPPLNPNLRVYVELSNEVWNYFSDAFRQFGDLIYMTVADADAYLDTSSNPLARPEDFPILNYDNLPTTKNGLGQYDYHLDWSKRKMILRIIQISEIFREVWGDDNMMSRIRPLYEWQYADDNGTASGPLKFADDYFNNGDGNTHVAEPRPINYYIFGGGGATYYGASNGFGVTDQLVNSDFESSTVSTGYTQAPSGHVWSFTGTAGLARDAGSGDDIPPAFNGEQMAYIDGDGSMTITVTTPSTQVSDRYAVVFKAVQRIQTDAPLDSNNNPIPDAQKVRILINGTPSNARSFNQDGLGFVPVPWNSDVPWESQVVFWTRGTPYYSSKAFSAETNETITITLEGLGDADNVVFIEDVRLASIDAIYESGFPGGGEALGQPAGTQHQESLNIQADWALAYGLKYTTYEGGWSLGSDTGGSPMQNEAKYTDERTADVNLTALQMFQKAGGYLNTHGTYALWPSWFDALAEEGLLDAGSYPLLQGQLASMNTLPVAATLGLEAPAIMNYNSVALARMNTAATLNTRGWMSWNVYIPDTGNHTISIDTGSGGNLTLAVDDSNIVVSGASGGTLSGSHFLTKGIHALKVRNTSGNFEVQELRIVRAGAPDSPTITGVVDSDLTLTVNWSTVSGATGYRVRWGTTSGNYSGSADVGASTSYAISGLSHNQAYYIVVGAYNAESESLPSGEVVAIAAEDGQPAVIAGWDLLAAGATSGASVSAPVYGVSSRVTASDITRGSGFTVNTLDAFQGRGAINTGTTANITTLAVAKSSNFYLEWSIAPIEGYKFSLDEIEISGYSQSTNGILALEFSTDGFATSGTQVSGTLALDIGFEGSTGTFDVSSYGALQDTEDTITFRAYIYGTSVLGGRGIGGIAGSNNDVQISGALYALDTTPSITTTTLPAAVDGQAYSQSLSATGGDGTLTWSVISGSLPSGLSLASNGLISGTPTSAGTANFTAQVSDEDSDTDSQALTLNVMAVTAAPSFSPNGGTYTSTQNVSITSATSGASIRYTVDGSTPTSSTGTLYSGPFSVSASTTIKAIAYNTGMVDSNVSTASYTINTGGSPVVLAAWDLLADGSSAGGATSANATTEATNISAGSITRGSGFASYNLDAFQGNGAFNSANAPSYANAAAAASAGYYAQWTVSPDSGYNMSLSELVVKAYSQSTNTLLAIEFSTDGFTTSGTSVGSALALDTGWFADTATYDLSGFTSLQDIDSTVTFRGYFYGTNIYGGNGLGQVSGYNNDVQISGTVSLADTQPVIFTTSLPDATEDISYAENIQATGGNGTLVWSVISGSLPSGMSLSSSGLLSGIPTSTGTASFTVQVVDEDSDSDTQAFDLDVLVRTASPVFSPTGGTYTSTQNVSITSATSGASIRYTTDGSNPSSTTGTVYSSPISVSETTTLKAIAYNTGMADSAVTSATFSIPLVLAAWDLLADGSSAGGATSASATTEATNVSAGSITRGSGFASYNLDAFQGYGAFNSANVLNFANASAAGSAGYYMEWSISPDSGYAISLDQIELYAYGQSTNANLAVEFSLDGFATSGTSVGSSLAMVTGWFGDYVAYDLTGFTALQNTEDTITFRGYIFGSNIYGGNGIGQVSGYNNDIAITGIVEEAESSMESMLSAQEEYGNPWRIAPVGESQIQSSWMGVMYLSPEYSPWVYSYDLGWLYPFGNDAGGFWAYSFEGIGAGFIYLSEPVYPFVYGDKMEKWILITADSEGREAWVYQHDDNTWTYINHKSAN